MQKLESSFTQFPANICNSNVLLQLKYGKLHFIMALFFPLVLFFFAFEIIFHLIIRFQYIRFDSAGADIVAQQIFIHLLTETRTDWIIWVRHGTCN